MVSADRRDFVHLFVGVHQVMLCRVATQAVEMVDDADSRGCLHASAHIRCRDANFLCNGVNGEVLRYVLTQKIDHLYRHHEVGVLFLWALGEMVALIALKCLQKELLHRQIFVLIGVSSLYCVFVYDVQKRVPQLLVSNVGLQENAIVGDAENLIDLLGRNDAVVRPFLAPNGMNSAAVDHNDVAGLSDVAIVFHVDGLRPRDGVDKFGLAMPVGKIIVILGSIVHINAAGVSAFLEINAFKIYSIKIDICHNHPSRQYDSIIF